MALTTWLALSAFNLCILLFSKIQNIFQFVLPIKRNNLEKSQKKPEGHGKPVNEDSS